MTLISDKCPSDTVKKPMNALLISFVVELTMDEFYLLITGLEVLESSFYLLDPSGPL